MTFVKDFVARAIREQARDGTIVGCLHNLRIAKSDAILREMFARAAFMTVKGIPFDALSGHEFDVWMDSLYQLFAKSLPDALRGTRTVVDNALPVLDDILSAKDNQDLMKAKVVVAVTDGWSGADGLYWIGIIFVFVDDIGSIHYVGTDFFSVLNRGAEALATHLLASFQESLGIDTTVALLVTDGAMVEKKAADICDIDHWWCVDHRFSLVLEHALAESKAKQLYDSVTETVTVVRASEKLTALLDGTQENMNMPARHFISFSKTRWAGIYYSGERFLLLASAVIKLGHEGLCPIIVLPLILSGAFNSYEFTCPLKFWEHPEMLVHLQACQPVVKVIAEAIKQLEGENYVTLSRVPSWLAKINKVITDNEDDDEYVVDLKLHLVKQVTHYFNNFFGAPNFALIAAALDVRYTLLKWCVPHVQTEVWEMIAEQTLELSQNVPGVSLTVLQALLPSFRALLATKHAEEKEKKHTDATYKWPDPIQFLLPILSQPGSFFSVFKVTAVTFLSCPATSAVIERYFKNPSFLQAGRPGITSSHLAMQTRIRSALLASPFDVNAVLTETKSRMALQSETKS